jgi:hypothetical protein
MVDAPAPDPQATAGHAPSASDRIVLRELLQQLGSRVRREQLETWFRSLDVRRIDDQEIELSVTSQFVRDWLQKNFLPLLPPDLPKLHPHAQLEMVGSTA